MSTVPNEQLSLLPDRVTITTVCLRPDLKASSAYRYGCRCTRCVTAKNTYTDVTRCDVEDCNRPIYKRSTRCMDHVGMCRAPGCTLIIKQEKRGKTKYCAEHTTSRARDDICPLCTTVTRRYVPSPYTLCPHCITKWVGIVTAAKAHRLPEDILCAWIRKPECTLCHRHLWLGRSKYGKDARSFAVDHDHTTCHPGPTGCADCIRGLLCQTCNLQLGQTESLIARVGDLEGIAAYTRSRR